MAEPLQGIDVAAAQAALDAAGGMPDALTPQDPWGGTRDPATGQFVSNTPDPAPTPDADPAPAADAPPAPEADTGDDYGSFTEIDPSTLTPEQLQMQRSLQADYTRKMQEAAPWRKLAEETGLSSPDEFKQAAEVYQRLQDPRNWPTIHGELTQYMQQYGMTPAQASAAASDQMMQFAPDTAPPAPDYTGFNPDEADPSIAPLIQQVQQLSNQVTQLTQQTTQERQQQQNQAQWNAVAQHLTQVENGIRAQNPHYGDNEIAAIYNMMGPDGDLAKAQQTFESLIGAQVSKYIAGKAGAAEGQPTPVGGAAVIPQTESGPMTMEQGHRAAMAHVAALERAE